MTRPWGRERTWGSAGRVVHSFRDIGSTPTLSVDQSSSSQRSACLQWVSSTAHTRRTATTRSVPSSSLTVMSDMVVSTSPAAVKAAYACQVCHRAYERLDHLNRHLDSRNDNLGDCMLDFLLMDYRPQCEVVQMLRVS
jgi:hypothetical protein